MFQIALAPRPPRPKTATTWAQENRPAVQQELRCPRERRRRFILLSTSLIVFVTAWLFGITISGTLGSLILALAC